MAGGVVEREIKLGAWPGFELPDLTDVAPGVTTDGRPTLHLDAAYVDTADLRLVRRGVSLRRRTGEGPTRWTLKLPSAGSGIVLSRREFDVDSDADTVPDELADLIAAWVRSAPLEPVATIRTERRRLALVGADAEVLAELADDEVSVVEGDEHVAARFRELEVELAADASADLLTLVAERLQAAGAGAPDQTTKIVRALGPRALAPPELAAPDVGKGATTGELVVAGLVRAARNLVDHDHVIRLDDDVEGVHKARVATRRLRSDLKTFAPVLDGTWAHDLRSDLSWLADELGVVRDTDVLLERLWDGVAALDEADRGAGALLVRRLEDERRAQLAGLLDAMRTDRYVDLLDRVVEGALHPALDKAAATPAADVAASLVAPRWNRLRKAVKALGDHPTDDELHAVRILAKRTRYASDVVGPVVGPPAEGLSSALAHLQDVLGELHDTAVAVAWLRRQVPAVPHDQAMVAGQLIAGERARAAELRAAWPGAWSACHRGRVVRWLR